jgi:hypothetical protein
VCFEVLLYDLTGTYFESDPPGAGKRQFGFSRDRRFDGVQVVIALIVIPEGFPIAYEFMPRNTSDNNHVARFSGAHPNPIRQSRADLRHVPRHSRRGGPGTDAQRRDDGSLLFGTPNGHSSKLEQIFLTKPWEQVREEV